MNRILILSLLLNLGLFSVLIIDMKSRSKEEQKEEISNFKMRNELNSTVRYTANLVDRIDQISKIADLSNDDIRKAYENSIDHKISKQLALDSVYVIKEWIDRTKKETEKWPKQHMDEIDKALTRE